MGFPTCPGVKVSRRYTKRRRVRRYPSLYRWHSRERKNNTTDWSVSWPTRVVKKRSRSQVLFSTDVQKQFNSVPLKEGLAQEMTVFWTTPLNLMKYTRLVMGAKNASSITQALFTHKNWTWITQVGITWNAWSTFSMIYSASPTSGLSWCPRWKLSFRCVAKQK